MTSAKYADARFMFLMLRGGQQRWGWRGRLISLSLLASICASFCPIPLPLPAVEDKDRSVPFPCQNRPCGCRSAAQCWQHCCCFSHAEKLAWARKNGVTPPGFVVAAVVQQPSSPEAESVCCCSRSGEGAAEECVEAPASVTPRAQSCCADGSCGRDPAAQHCDAQEQPTQDHDAQEPDNGVGYVIGLMAQRCQGQGDYLQNLPWVVLAAPQSPPSPPCVGPADRVVDQTLVDRPLEPQEPPPRLALSTLLLA